MKSTLFNMTAVLLGITLIASAGVGYVNMITAEPIAQAKEDAKKASLTEVLPAFDETTTQELTIDEMQITVYTATTGDALTGYAVETMTKQGFGGVVRMMVGFTPAGEVINVKVLEQSETPGLGTKMEKEDNSLITGIKGQNPADKKLVNGKLAVTKDGGDVDALTAATISSRAYLDAVNRAWMAYKSVAAGTEPTDVATGASRPTEQVEGAETAETAEPAEAAEVEPAIEPAAQEGGQNE